MSDEDYEMLLAEAHAAAIEVFRAAGDYDTVVGMVLIRGDRRVVHVFPFTGAEDARNVPTSSAAWARVLQTIALQLDPPPQADTREAVAFFERLGRQLQRRRLDE